MIIYIFAYCREKILAKMLKIILKMFFFLSCLSDEQIRLFALTTLTDLSILRETNSCFAEIKFRHSVRKRMFNPCVSKNY